MENLCGGTMLGDFSLTWRLLWMCQFFFSLYYIDFIKSDLVMKWQVNLFKMSSTLKKADQMFGLCTQIFGNRSANNLNLLNL